ncbi:MAG: hypothetical protein MZU91_01535 [Desulfosudis oleivorans]|nr:hypothetical protein [Desulfosudis oleivorans]
MDGEKFDGLDAVASARPTNRAAELFYFFFFFPACFQKLPRVLHDGFGLVLRQDEG